LRSPASPNPAKEKKTKNVKKREGKQEKDKRERMQGAREEKTLQQLDHAGGGPKMGGTDPGGLEKWTCFV